MVQNLTFLAEIGYMGSRFDEMAIRQGIMSETSGFNEAEVQDSFYNDSDDDDLFDF